MDDFELISRCAQNDPVARDAFIKQYLGVICGSIRKATNSRFVKFGKRLSPSEYEEVISDLSHDVVIALFKDDCKGLMGYKAKDGCPLGGYIGTIAVRKAIDYWRRKKDENSIQEAEESEFGSSKEMIKAQTDPDAHQFIEAFMNKETTSILLSHLNQDERQLCEYIYFEEMETGAIAKLLNISVDNLYMRKKRLLAKLREIAIQKNIC